MTPSTSRRDSTDTTTTTPSRQRWHELEQLLATRPRTSRTRSEPKAAELSRRYRAACADLALADANRLPAATVSYLHDLVARSHVAFYRTPRGATGRALRGLLRDAPARLYLDPAVRLGLAVFYGTFFLAAGWAYLDPRSATNLVGAETLLMMREMYLDAPDDRGISDGAAMTGFYIFNNVGIAFRSFAGGIFCGVGSLLILAFNGLYLGSVFGLIGREDEAIRQHFFTFVTAHGPFELTGIALAGAAGLRLGWGLVETGGRPRMQSLARSTRQSMPLLLFGGALVAAAAPIEGFISPSSLPYFVKAATAAASALLIVLYIVVLGGRAARAMNPEERDASRPG